MLSKLRQSPQTRQELLRAAALFAGVSFVFFFLLRVFIDVGVYVPWHSWRSEDNSETQFSPPTLSVPENELQSSGLRGSDFNH